MDSIEEAQELVALVLSGEEHPRLPYGQEPRVGDHEPPRHCRDCGAHMGQLHIPMCEWEACPRCRRILWGCGCRLELEVWSCGCRLPIEE